jgi:hypothetical protein
VPKGAIAFQPHAAARWTAHSRLFDQEGCDRTRDGFLNWEDADNVGAAFDLAIEPLDRVVLCTLVRWAAGNVMWASPSGSVRSRKIASLGSFGRTWSATLHRRALPARRRQSAEATG